MEESNDQRTLENLNWSPKSQFQSNWFELDFQGTHSLVAGYTFLLSIRRTLLMKLKKNHKYFIKLFCEMTLKVWFDQNKCVTRTQFLNGN